METTVYDSAHQVLPHHQTLEACLICRATLVLLAGGAEERHQSKLRARRLSRVRLMMVLSFSTETKVLVRVWGCDSSTIATSCSPAPFVFVDAVVSFLMGEFRGWPRAARTLSGEVAGCGRLLYS